MYPSWVYSQEKFQSIMAVINDSDNKNETGGRLNKKDGLTRYGNSHVKDKTS